jgi:ubiquinone/menaquinone biosynthesis C-methylase UbiE
MSASISVRPQLARWRERRRRTGSLCLRQTSLLRRAIAATQGTALGPYVTPQTFELSTSGEALASGRREYEDGPSFFSHFYGRLTLDDLRERDVLDLGCGYGGRTVYYAREGQVHDIHGIDISQEVVRRCSLLARELGAPQARFETGRAEALPYDDASFDLVLSYDVLEHVEDPATSLLEIARVLRPGGAAWLIFPSYLGALSSHLDYLTMIPALHRVFDPQTIIEVVNEFLSAEPERLGVALQPPPRMTPVGREALPSLNGMCAREAMQYVLRSGLEIAYQRVTPITYPDSRYLCARVVSGPLGYLAEKWGLPDLLIARLSLGLRKPISA